VNVREIYYGSDGEATKALYARLADVGPVGHVAVNLFRAQKCSERAKLYRGGVRGRGSYRSMAYDRKQWSMDLLCKVLAEHAEALKIGWGWKLDPDQAVHCWVLYVDLPTGQASFHTEARGTGPDYPGDWDGQRGVCPGRIIAFAESVLARAPAAASLFEGDDG
jgi:hypothetical protein